MSETNEKRIECPKHYIKTNVSVWEDRKVYIARPDNHSPNFYIVVNDEIIGMVIKEDFEVIGLKKELVEA